MATEFTKHFFQTSWGDGYYEKFSYGVGLEKVCQVALYPFFDRSKTALEIGPGGGVFTEKMIKHFRHLTAIDVISKPAKFNNYPNFTYIELPNKSYDCPGIENSSIDFCFSYNLFCHLSNTSLTEYFKNINRVLKPGADFVFMLANFEHSKQHVPNPDKYKLGDFLQFGHFYQDERTIYLIADKSHWQIINSNMLPDHRDIIVHLKKTYVFTE